MATETEICNQALAACGARDTIANLQEASNAARQCNTLYVPTRDQLLSMAPWDFARATLTLSLLKALPGTPENPSTTDLPTTWQTDWPPPPWYYEYLQPPDSVFVRYIIPQFADAFVATWAPGPGAAYPNPATPMRFVKATDNDDQGQPLNVILTNAPGAIAVYTRRVTNTQAYSEGFRQALVAALAAKLSIPLSGDKQLAASNYSVANSLIVLARETDGNEGLTIQDTTPDWLAIRSTFSADAWPANYDLAGGITYPPLFVVS